MRSLIEVNQRSQTTQSGVTLIEMVVFIVVVSIAMGALVSAYRKATAMNVNPIIRVQALEAAQAKLDEILMLRYDEQTPVGGVPACNTGTVICDNTREDNMNDVDDYHNRTDNPYPGYIRTVTVVTNNNIKLISVGVTTPAGETIFLAAERANF